MTPKFRLKPVDQKGRGISGMLTSSLELWGRGCETSRTHTQRKSAQPLETGEGGAWSKWPYMFSGRAHTAFPKRVNALRVSITRKGETAPSTPGVGPYEQERCYPSRLAKRMPKKTSITGDLT